jgi:hypothetical protein
MNRLPYVMLALALTVAAVVEIATSSLLPAAVTARYAVDGTPRGATLREVYLAIMLGVTVGLPLLIVASMTWIPRMAPSRLNLPNREYWLAPARLAETYATLRRFACVMGIMVTLFGLAVHLLVVSANLSDGRRLSPAFVVLLVAFVTALVAWIAAMLWRFRRPSR